MESASYNRLETPFYACLRDICHALEHRSVLLRQQTSAWTCRLLVTKLFGPYSACFIGHDTLQHTCLNKRTLDYDTIGGLFGDLYLGVHELTVVEKIWAIIIEVVAVVSELIGADSDELTIQIIENDKRLAALREYAQTA